MSNRSKRHQSSSTPAAPQRPGDLILAALLVRDGGACVWCRRPLSADDPQTRASTLIRTSDGNPRVPANVLLACAACDEERGGQLAAQWLLRCVDAGLQPNWQVVVAALERLHQAHKRLRALTTPQLATLTHGRLAGERGQSGRYRKLLTRDGDGCVWCGKSLAGGSETTLEHILPRGLGGPDTLANTMCACGDCNNRRQEMRVGAWVATCEYRGLKPRRAALEAVLNGLVAMGGREAVAAQRELDVLGSGMGRRRRPVTARSPMRRWR